METEFATVCTVISKNSDFTKCSTCSQLDDQYQEAHTEEVRHRIINLKEAHDKQVELERKAYHKARERARTDAREVTCIILDGMDQSKTNVPHFIVKDKDNDHLAQLPVHFTGVLVHTGTAEGKIPFVFYDVKHVPHDSNLTVHCLTAALNRTRLHLGKVLFLQLDNCFRENKNKYVFTFLALLVEMKIFKEVLVHFLPVGHTHEDVDQMFSCISRHLRSKNAYTLPDLVLETTRSYTPPVTVVPVTMIQNCKSKLQDMMAGSYSNHSKPLWFRFRNFDGKCHMHYRMWATDEWRPSTDSELTHGLVCLKTLPDLTEKLEWVVPTLDKLDPEKLTKDLPRGYNNRLPLPAREWWTNFMEETLPKDYKEVPVTKLSWQLTSLMESSNGLDVDLEGIENLQGLESRINQQCPDEHFILDNRKMELEACVTVKDNIQTTDVVSPGEEVLLNIGNLSQKERKGRRDNPNIIYGVEDRPPWATVALMGLQHFSLTFSGCFALTLIVAGPLCFNLDRELLNQLLGTSFFIAGITTFLQIGFGTRLPIVQGSSAAFLLPAIVICNLKGPCPPPITSNSTEEERQYVREVAFERMQELQGSICVASLVQFLIGFTGLVGVLLRFIRPITVATTLILIGLPILTMASDACGTHWGISSVFMLVVILCSQFWDKYSIPLPGGNRLALFTFFPILLAVAVSWSLCLILTVAGALPDSPTEYGYKARTDLYNDVIRESTWIRFPYPGQFGAPRASFAGILGMLTAVLASMIESVGDYYACSFISNVPPPPVHAINRGISMEGLGCLAGGLWGAPCGYTSYSNNVSAISLTKVASRVTAYFAAGIFVIGGIFYKFNAFCAAMPEPVLGGIMGSTFGMVASIGFANLAFIKVNTSRNLFILGFALFLGMGVPDYLMKNPGAINTGVVIVDQVLSVILGSNMFLGGLTACILDNLVRGTPEEKGINWIREMSGLTDEDEEEEIGNKPSCYDLPFGMNWIRKTHWTRYLPFSPTYTVFRKTRASL